MRRSIILFLILALCAGSAIASEKKIEKRFDGKRSVEIETVSGDCIVSTHGSGDILVEVVYDSDIEDVVDFKFREHSNKLSIEEDWRGSGSGSITWMLTLPEGTNLEFSSASGDFEGSGNLGDFEGSTASGDFEVEGVKGSVEISVASGDIDISNCSGEYDISTASGDISIKDCTGEIDLSTASGDIEASGLNSDDIEISAASGDIEISDSKGGFELSVASGEVEAEGIEIISDSDFSTASGEIEVTLAASPRADISLATASGDVMLDYKGNSIKGYFEFVARKKGGRIKSPFDFDNEEEFERNGRDYLRKSFSRKGDSPEIHLHTATGTVELKK